MISYEQWRFRKFFWLVFWLVIALTFSLLVLEANSQTVRETKVRLAFVPNSQDTVFIPLNELFTPSDSTVNFPPFAVWGGNFRFTFQRISGSAADSLAILLKPASRTGGLYVATGTALDSLWVFGSSTFTTTYANIGDGRLWSAQVTGFFDPTLVIAAIIRLGDFTGGTRRFEIGGVKQ